MGFSNLLFMQSCIKIENLGLSDILVDFYWLKYYIHFHCLHNYINTCIIIQLYFNIIIYVYNHISNCIA